MLWKETVEKQNEWGYRGKEVCVWESKHIKDEMGEGKEHDGNVASSTID